MKPLLYAILLAMAVHGASALIDSVSHKCEESCMSGAEITWNVSLENRGEQEITVASIEILDKKGATLAKKSLNTTVAKKISVPMTGEVPKVKNASEIFYTVCLTTLIPRESRLYEDIYYGIENTYCDSKNRSFFAIQCRNDSGCGPAEACSNSSCTALSCGQCSLAIGHSCRKLECCSDDACMQDEMCANNTCAGLSCAANESARNHTCAILSCRDDEAIANHSCKLLACGENEFPRNGKCEKVNCLENETIANRTCVPLQCAADEKAQNHSCEKLQCDENERPEQHQCSRIACLPHQSVENRACGTDMKKVYSILELPLMAAILALSVLLARAVHGKLVQRRRKSEEIYNQAEKLVK